MARMNKISADFNDDDKNKAIAKINDLKASLPFLVNLSVDDRKRLKGIGTKNLDYVQKCLEGAIAFPDEMKKSFDISEFKRDVVLFNNLLGVQIACLSLLELIDDSMKAAGIDSMTSAKEVYDSLKSSAKSNANVKAIVAEIAVRFAAQKKPRGKKQE